jgi:succinoglycan biosynthesis protein ExoA
MIGGAEGGPYARDRQEQRGDGTVAATRVEGPLAAADLVVVVPAVNEERYIEACLRSLLAQSGAGAFQILVMDGGSTDRTVSIVRQLEAQEPRVRLVDNSRRLQAAAINLAAKVAAVSARVIVRADAHACYPNTFVAACATALVATGATSVVVPMRTVGRTGFQRAVAAVQNSRVGNGGSLHRVGGVSGFVDHGHHAAFHREFFCALGGYDETFSHNEDAEYDFRARRAGGAIWLCADAPVTYFPRADPWRLARQYFNHGRGRARMLRRHGLHPRPRQAAPLLALLGTAGALAAAPVAPAALAIPMAYFAACLGWSAWAAVRMRDSALLAAAIAAPIMHLSWAAGFICIYAGPGTVRPADGTEKGSRWWQFGRRTSRA